MIQKFNLGRFKCTPDAKDTLIEWAACMLLFWTVFILTLCFVWWASSSSNHTYLASQLARRTVCEHKTCPTPYTSTWESWEHGYGVCSCKINFID